MPARIVDHRIGLAAYFSTLVEVTHQRRVFGFPMAVDGKDLS